MIHNLRKAERFPLSGEIELMSGANSLGGQLVDVSTDGVAFTILPETVEQTMPKRIWLCRIYSNDLPGPAVFMARVLRTQTRGYRVELACQIVAISEKSLSCVRAYRALVKARERNMFRMVH
jgi:hypothetical protein